MRHHVRVGRDDVLPQVGLLPGVARKVREHPHRACELRSAEAERPGVRAARNKRAKEIRDIEDGRVGYLMREMRDSTLFWVASSKATALKARESKSRARAA